MGGFFRNLGLVGLLGLTFAGVVEAQYNHCPRNAISHTVVKGDTFFDLGKRYGVSDIMDYNPGVNPNSLKVGSTLWIPEKIVKSYMPEFTSEKGKEDIRKFENFSDAPYRDPAHGDTWTIGFGHQIRPGERFVKITREKALELFEKDIKEVENAIRDNVIVDLSQEEYDALSSFGFTIKPGDFKDSTLLKYLNDGNYADAIDEFPRWIKSDGRVVPGLIPRRDFERSKMFFGIVNRDPRYFNRVMRERGEE